jgi:hypothetical protein
MAKKRKKKSKAFSAFKRDKKTLKAPMTTISESSPIPFEKSSWQDIQLPEYLWVALVFSSIEEDEALVRLRRIISEWPSHSCLENHEVQPGSHSAIAALPQIERKNLLNSLSNEFEKDIFAPLCNLSNLPALKSWSNEFLSEETLEQWFALGHAIQRCNDFQSKYATHICWFISQVGSATGQMTVPPDFDRMHDEYPKNLEMAGGFFRCTAGSNRIISTNWPEQFWKDVFRKLHHAPAPPEDQYLSDNDLGIAYQLTTLTGVLNEHFWETRQGSADRIHETAFGLVFAATALAYEVVELRSHNRFSGLAVLRSVTECAINMSFLTKKNEPALWYKFRQYGSGQAHLISEKLEHELANTHCVDSDWINAYLQEEQAKYFTDIELGDWSGENIRSRAEKGGTKDLYDSYYDYSSSILHGDWLGVASVGTTWDLNPFHRLQRVPRVYPRNFPSVVPDLFRVLNRILDSLDVIYPKFEFRLPNLLQNEVE